ncbi:MAG TPA: hypothetical protein VE954_32000 [Oligoflexus sp.]|uniref:hypothetical protein n=1 Tax=Oligoflexus sp. TaxID=1971216 RepID=UPI002D529D52|nr:hypothetical protein [Oligoflexus sp.]HYX37749.1 hypothetical protein [Oligoflexus sp.]
MKTFLALTSLLLGAAAPLMAHDGHNHEAATETAPHGGTLRNAGDYKAEIVINGDNLKLYIFDKQLKPMKLEKAELTGDVQFPKEKSKPVTFKKAGEFYSATVKGISKVHRYDMHVNLEVAGKKVVADFGIDNI